MNKEKRISRGENNFKKYIIPTISDHFPGLWQSSNGTEADMKHGIDWYYTDQDRTLSVAARVWESEPKQHFAVRSHRSSNPKNGLEIKSRLKALEVNGPLPTITIEGFIWSKWAYVAIIDSRLLWETVADNLDNLKSFSIPQSEGDKTVFTRIPFRLFKENQITKIIKPLI
tara:strand:+ start:193 stop:705 length:513 start_codon:yes stop_codon:yes gene_type:complete